MIVTKKALPRRTFLRGVGVTLALPLLDAMVPALTVTARTAANPVRRLGFIYCPNGVSMNSRRHQLLEAKNPRREFRVVADSGAASRRSATRCWSSAGWRIDPRTHRRMAPTAITRVERAPG